MLAQEELKEFEIEKPKCYIVKGPCGYGWVLEDGTSLTSQNMTENCIMGKAGQVIVGYSQLRRILGWNSVYIRQTDSGILPKESIPFLNQIAESQGVELVVL